MTEHKGRPPQQHDREFSHKDLKPLLQSEQGIRDLMDSQRVVQFHPLSDESDTVFVSPEGFICPDITRNTFYHQEDTGHQKPFRQVFIEKTDTYALVPKEKDSTELPRHYEAIVGFTPENLLHTRDMHDVVRNEKLRFLRNSL